MPNFGGMACVGPAAHFHLYIIDYLLMTFLYVFL
jgi:hypothetical protein